MRKILKTLIVMIMTAMMVACTNNVSTGNVEPKESKSEEQDLDALLTEAEVDEIDEKDLNNKNDESEPGEIQEDETISTSKNTADLEKKEENNEDGFNKSEKTENQEKEEIIDEKKKEEIEKEDAGINDNQGEKSEKIAPETENKPETVKEEVPVEENQPEKVQEEPQNQIVEEEVIYEAPYEPEFITYSYSDDELRQCVFVDYDLMAKINNERVQNGLEQLEYADPNFYVLTGADRKTVSEHLTNKLVANYKSFHVENGPISHDLGGCPIGGEILAAYFNTDSQNAVNIWLNSQPHKEIMLQDYSMIQSNYCFLAMTIRVKASTLNTCGVSMDQYADVSVTIFVDKKFVEGNMSY